MQATTGFPHTVHWDSFQLADAVPRRLSELYHFDARELARPVAFPGDGEPRPSGKEYRLAAALKKGLSQENAKKLSKLVRDEGPKGVKVQIQGDELRVSSKSRDALQDVIALLKDADVDCALQFTNYR